MNAVIDAGRDKKRTLREQLHEARKQMHSLLDTDSPSESAVMRQVEHIGALRTELRKEQLKTMLGVRALLSPEQRAVLRDAFGKHGRRGGHGKDRQRRHEGSHSGRPGR